MAAFLDGGLCAFRLQAVLCRVTASNLELGRGGSVLPERALLQGRLMVVVSLGWEESAHLAEGMCALARL